MDHCGEKDGFQTLDVLTRRSLASNPPRSNKCRFVCPKDPGIHPIRKLFPLPKYQDLGDEIFRPSILRTPRKRSGFLGFKRFLANLQSNAPFKNPRIISSLPGSCKDGDILFNYDKARQSHIEHGYYTPEI